MDEESRLELIERLADCRIPNHLAIILDGNRRWATENGFEAIEGHRRGFEVSKILGRFCRRIGIHTVTVWAFSTENWKRAQTEVAALMSLFEESLAEILPEAIEEEVRIHHIGRREGVPAEVRSDAAASGFGEGLPSSLLQVIDDVEKRTAEFRKHVLNLAINYGGADEIARALERMLAEDNDAGHVTHQLEDFLDTAGQLHPNPDLVIRTSGEIRLSGFMPLQTAYAELSFVAKHFPQLDESDMTAAIEEYSQRMRRYGG